MSAALERGIPINGQRMAQIISAAVAARPISFSGPYPPQAGRSLQRRLAPVGGENHADLKMAETQYFHRRQEIDFHGAM